MKTVEAAAEHSLHLSRTGDGERLQKGRSGAFSGVGAQATVSKRWRETVRILNSKYE